MKPQWKHDCNTCKFVGRKEQEDVYVCIKRSHQGTVIGVVMRYSDEGAGYWSGSIVERKQI